MPPMLKFVQTNSDDGFVQRTTGLWPAAGRALMFYVYFLRSISNGKVYVEKTSKEPVERLKEHNSGKNHWTKANRPFKLIYYEQYVCKEDAAKREPFYKTGFGKKVKKA